MKNIPKRKCILFILLMTLFGSIGCTKQSGCEYVVGDTYYGVFQYHKEPLENIGSNVHAELEFQYENDIPEVIYFDGFIPKEFRTEEAIQVTLVCEPIGYFQYYPIYHKIKCIEKVY